MLLIQVFKNKVVFYLASRYLTYFIQFVTSLIIAVKLGPYYMGIWGFILLLLNYFQQLHFGISNSFNVLFVQNKDDEQKCNDYMVNSMVLISYLAICVLLFYITYLLFGNEWFEKYNASKYIPWVCIIAILQYFVQFFTNLFRVKNQLNYVAFCQSAIIVLTFFCVFIFKEEILIKFLVLCYVIGNLLCVFLFLFSGCIPRVSDVHINLKYQKEIIKKGLYLFLYNSCFYFIIISDRTFISANYSVEEFGLFCFSFTMAQAIMLVLDSLTFIVFPKVIYKLSSDSSEEIVLTISRLRKVYIPSAHLLIYLALPCFPLLLLFMPKYEFAIPSFNMIALTILINTSSFGYLELLISRNRESVMAKMSVLALIINCLIAASLIWVMKVGVPYVVTATLMTYVLFAISAVYYGQHCLSLHMNYVVLFYEVFPIRLFVPYCLALLLVIWEKEFLMVLPLGLFILLNFKRVVDIKDIVRKLLLKPETVNL